MARYLSLQHHDNGKVTIIISNTKKEGQCWELQEGGIIHDTVTPAAEVRLQQQINELQENISGIETAAQEAINNA